MTVFYTSLMCFQFVFTIFWLKEIDPKAACKILVKLTTVLLRREPIQRFPPILERLQFNRQEVQVKKI